VDELVGFEFGNGFKAKLVDMALEAAMDVVSVWRVLHADVTETVHEVADDLAEVAD
jgi:ACT domain-containing protein